MMGFNINITGGMIIFGFVLMAIAFLIEKQLNEPNEYSTLFYLGMISAFVGIVFKLRGQNDRG